MATELERMGFWWQRWAELRDGKRPPQNDARDPGVWPHGWQHWASVVSDTHSGDQFAVTHRQNTRRAHGEQCTHLILSHLISSHLISLLIIALSHTPAAPEHTLSVCSCWRASTACHWRHSAAGATNHLIFGDTTSRLSKDLLA